VVTPLIGVALSSVGAIPTDGTGQWTANAMSIKFQGAKITGTNMSQPIFHEVLDPTKTQNSAIRIV
jgi:hypothetical protein